MDKHKVTLTKITSSQPETLTKQYALDDSGNLQKSTVANMVNGLAKQVTLSSAEDMAKLLSGLKTNNALCYGITPKPDMQLLSKAEYEKQKKPAGATTRTKDMMQWPTGGGVLMLDYDPAEGARALTKSQLIETLTGVLPELSTSAWVWWCSSSSLIYNDETQLHGIRGQRVYILVKDASDIPRAGKVLFKRLWLAGHGFFMISRAGTALERTIIDGSVWQPNRLDFAAGAQCTPPLEQRRGLPEVHEGAYFDTAKALPDLTQEQEADLQAIKDKLKDQIAPKAHVKRAEYIEKEARNLLASAGKDASDEALKDAKNTINRAAQDGVLASDFIITLDDKTEITIGELLDNPSKYHKRKTLDPLEPEYNGHKVVGILYLMGGQSNLFSRAHGDKNYRLIGAKSSEKAQIKWASPVDLFSSLPVPSFPMDCLPKAMTDYFSAVAKASGFDVGAYAFCGLITASGHINHSHKVQISNSYSQNPVLWAGLNDSSGGGKSSIMDTAIEPVKYLDNLRVKESSFQLNEWYSKTQKAKDSNEKSPSSKPPFLQRMINDTTTEAAAKLLVDNDGLFLHHDELTEFIGRMDAYSGASGKDRGVYLKSFDGASVMINRAGKQEPLYIQCFSLAILAGMQPDTLARLFNRSGGGASSDGLFQRFLMYIISPAKGVDFSVEVSEQDKRKYFDLFNTIEKWNTEGGYNNDTKLTAEARDAHQDYVNHIRVIAARTSAPRFREHLNKFQAFVIRIALTLHCLECAEQGNYKVDLSLETYN